MTSITPPMTQQHFKAGLKHLILHEKSPDGGDHPLRYRALGLIMLIGVIDNNIDDVNFAMGHGCDVNMTMTDGMKSILTDMGWQLPGSPRRSSPGSEAGPSESQVQSLEPVERYPNG